MRPDVRGEEIRSRSRHWFVRCFLFTSIALVLAATLLPAEPEGEGHWDRVFCVLCGRASLADGLANIGLFLPVGAALGLQGYALRLALLGAAVISVSVELAQFAIPGRDPNLADFAFNMLGAGLGIGLLRSARLWMAPSARAASRLGLVAALAASTTFALTDVLLRASFPQGQYFGGSNLLDTSSTALRLGGTTDSRSFFRGRIDDLRIYSRARTPSEIQSDLSMPVTAAAGLPDLVAAYSFDEGSGAELTDVSGRGHGGMIRGATWTSHGKFNGALAFDGAGDVVVIPHTSSLNLTMAMTLEAWIFPTGVQKGWHAIIQKEPDLYFLSASSGAGALKPGGGGTFGSSTETVAAADAVPSDAWTHLALTYDGAVLQLYVNGRPVARRLRWYPGRVLGAWLGGLAMPAGASTESSELRKELLSGAPLRVHAIAAPPAPAHAPFVTLHDRRRREVLLLGAEKEDLVFRLRTRATDIELDTPAILARGVLRGISPGEDFVVTVSRGDRGYCVGVNDSTTCGLGFTPGMGWGLIAFSQTPTAWPHFVLNAVWMAACSFPTGFWARWRWESLLAVMVLAAGIVLPCTLGSLSASLAEIVGAVIGAVGGSTTQLASVTLAATRVTGP